MLRYPSLLLAAACLVGAPAALADPPGNDSPGGAAPFETYTAPNGTPVERQAVAAFAEATADLGVPRCLGASSFARTVWFTVPAAATAREIVVEATGTTLAVPDLAAFVQPEGGTTPVTDEPNACSGVGAGGAEESEEPSSAVALRIPANRSVLIQAGRRGSAGASEDEQSILSLRATNLAATTAPAGDRASDAPAFDVAPIALAGATVTEEDPAQPVCPSLGSVWRRLVPTSSGPRRITVEGAAVATLTAFSGARPTGDNAVDCINRSVIGPLSMTVPTVAGEPLWIRVGTDRPATGATATLKQFDVSTAKKRSSSRRRSARRVGTVRLLSTRSRFDRPSQGRQETSR